MRFMKSRIAITLILFLIAAGGGAALWLSNYLDRPLNIEKQGYLIEIASGTALRSVANQLATDGILSWPRLFSTYGRLSGNAERIKAGEYELSAGITPRALLELLVAGRVKLHTITIVEGWTVAQLLQAIQKHPAISQTLKLESTEALSRALELEDQHPEGLFFPDTYSFARGTTDRELLIRAHDLMQDRLTAAWSTRQPDLPLTDSYQALILASIVERETALDSERPQIAGVFSRRLDRRMRLQTDPTVIYGLGEDFDGNLTRRHLETDSPYNTYTRAGLPPTPIALPGESSLLAAVNPDNGDSLYFVATGLEDGSHHFTATLDEHNAAVQKYLARLRERNR